MLRCSHSRPEMLIKMVLIMLRCSWRPWAVSTEQWAAADVGHRLLLNLEAIQHQTWL